MYHEQVGKTGYHRAKIGGRAICPLVRQRSTLTAFNIDPGHRACDCVKASRHDDHIQFVLGTLRSQARFSELDNRRSLDVDQRDIPAVVHFVVAVPDAQALAADGIGRRTKQLCRLGILDY